MAKRELSSTLRNLKFMQRAAQRQEKSKKEEQVIPDAVFPSLVTLKKCVVIMEGDPHPGLLKGRMSFQNFNPSIDKLNGEARNIPQSEPSSATCSVNQNGRISDRENASTLDGSQIRKPNMFDNDANVEHKRKQDEVVSEAECVGKSQKNSQVDLGSSSNNGRSSHKKPKREKLDWNVLRPPKGHKKG
ncbi:hypothetical protein NMG60_11014569 [Bertholletia excelsa]